MSEADSDSGTKELLIACEIASTNPQKERLLFAVSKKKIQSTYKIEEFVQNKVFCRGERPLDSSGRATCWSTLTSRLKYLVSL